MATSPTGDKRVQFLKQDGTELFAEGDIVGATEMYIAAMQLETDLALENIISENLLENTAKEDVSLEGNNNSTGGMSSILEAVLEDAEEAIKVNPSLPKAYLAKATALLLQNKWDEARDVYIKGIKNCCRDNCTELRQALQKLYKTQALLKSIPTVIEKTRSVSSYTSSESTTEGRSSPTCRSRRFRIQHRKKLSRPMVDCVMSSNPEVFNSKDDGKAVIQSKDRTQENAADSPSDN